MGKGILLSVIVATVALPMIAARDPSPLRAFKRTLWYAFWFNVAWAFGVIFVYPRV